MEVKEEGRRERGRDEEEGREGNAPVAIPQSLPKSPDS